MFEINGIDEAAFSIFTSRFFSHSLKDVGFVFCPQIYGELYAIPLILCQISSKQPSGPYWYTDTVFIQILLFNARLLN